MINTQTRAQIFLFLIILFYWITTETKKSKLKNLFFIFLLTLPLTFFMKTRGSEDIVIRFQNLEYEREIIGELSLNSMSVDQFGKFAPLIRGLKYNKNFTEIMFGHGYVRGRQGNSTHFHSAFGYIYASMGIVGIIIVYSVFILTIIKYRAFVKKTKIDCFEKTFMKLIIYYLIVQTVFSLIIGNFVQGYLISWGIHFGLLELCRRSILNQYYSKLKLPL